MNTRLIDAAKAAEYLDIDEETVRDMLRRGALPGFKLGRNWRMDVADLEQHVAALKVKVAA